jgi:hypothetical protein
MIGVIGNLDGLKDIRLSRLEALCGLAGIKPVPAKKVLVVHALHEFYSDTDNIWNVYNKLTDGEKSLVHLHIWNKGFPCPEIVVMTAKKHKMPEPNIGIPSCFGNSVGALLFPSGCDMPKFIFDILSRHLKQDKLDCPQPEFVPGENGAVICREGRASDFSALLLYKTGTKVSTNKKGVPSKAAAAKMLEWGRWDDVIDCDGRFGTPRQAKKATNFLITFAMFFLAQNCGIFSEGSILASMITSGAPEQEFIKRLLDIYISNDLAREIDIFENIAICEVVSDSWVEARKDILECVKALEPGRFYSYDVFEEWVRLTAYGFVRRNVGCLCADDKPLLDWEEGERQILCFFLLCFCAMGMLDLSFEENTNEESIKCTDEFGISVSGVRLTQLGAFILKKESSYKPREEKEAPESGLVVTPDFFAIVDGRRSLLKFAPFLSGFMSKTHSTGDACSFKIDYSGFVKALDQGIDGRQIADFLVKSSSKPVPENVLKTIDDWSERSKKIRIKTITVIEADDEYLLAEIAGLKGMDSCKFNPLSNMAEIDQAEADKIKKILVKNGKYVNIEQREKE